mmetsp:Transcript_17255/g.45648  ORF Transcript_17255/g.45648 Transcript_17255/m.45648 type:complete len:244 (+) Transcript_17255:700-1431(+)
MLVSLSRAFDSVSTSLPIAAFTSCTRFSSSFNISLWRESPLPCDSCSRNSSHFWCSSARSRSSFSMRCFSLPIFSVAVLVRSLFFSFQYSSISSLSWRFCIRNKFCSSSVVNTSRSCLGSSKYRGVSSPLEMSSYSASICSCVGYFFLMRRRLLSASFSFSLASSSTSFRCCRRRFPLRAVSLSFSSAALSSASSSACILLCTSAILLSTALCLRIFFLSFFSWSFWSFHSCGVNLSKKPLNL